MPDLTEITFALDLLSGQFDIEVPSEQIFRKALSVGERLVSIQVRKLSNLHLLKHGVRWPLRNVLEDRLRQTVLQAAPNSHHSRRFFNEMRQKLDDAEHRSVKRKEKELRQVFRGIAGGWPRQVKDRLNLFLEEFLSEKFLSVYSKVKRLTGCEDWGLSIPSESCCSVVISKGCTTFPNIPTQWLTVHPWSLVTEDCVSNPAVKEFVEECVVKPAKERLEQEQPPKPFVNHSTTVVSEEATELLNRGLSFVPSASSQDNFEVDVERFLNNLLWKDYWLNRKPRKVLDPLVEERLKTWPVQKEKSGAKAPMPAPGSTYLSLATSAEKFLKYNNLRRWPRPTPNVKTAALQEIKRLARSEKTIFVEADKGSGLILMDRAAYVEKMYRDVLEDGETYEEVTEETANEVETKFLGLLKQQKDVGELLSEESMPIVEADPAMPRMFGLPKLHKNGNPMRPVVSCVGSVLAKSAKLIDNVVKPAVMKGWQYLKDSTTTISYLESRFKQLLSEGFSAEEIYVVSFDVAAFYPSVPHDLAEQAFTRARDDLQVAEEQFRTLRKILRFHLENSFFRFHKKFFRQKSGLPIGSAIGGPIACLALALEEDRLLEELRNSKDPLAKIFEFYRRYLDDSILMFGAKKKEDAVDLANRLLGLLKSMNPAFDFTCTGAVKELVVLDIAVEISNQGLRLSNYQKPTDKRTLLSANSSHPTHIKKSIPYSVALRMRRLCSEETDFHQALIDQAWVLLGRGYTEEWIVDGFSRAVEKTREEALQKSKRNENTKNTVRLVTNFDPNIDVEKAFRKVRKEKRALSQTSNGTHLNEVHLQLAFRNAPNLRRLLVNKDPKEDEVSPERFEGFSKCQGGCILCKDVKDVFPIKKVPQIFVNSLSAGEAKKRELQEMKILTASCATTNLVYFAGCLQCGAFYIGETGDTFKSRCSRHRPLNGDRESCLKDGPNKNWSELRRHFATENHQGFWVAPLAVFAPDAPPGLRKKKEAAWIRRLKPPLNTKLQQKPEVRSRSSSVTSTGSPPVSPALRRKLGITSSRK